MEAMAPAAPLLSVPGRPHRLSPTFVALLGSMTALGAFTTDTYLPSLPAVGLDLGASPAATQLTISGTLIGGALGQLVIGPLSDRFGRRRPALIGIGGHIVASLLCVIAGGIVPLIGLRVLQGVGNSAAGVVAMAVIRDRYTGSTAARVMSRLMLIIGAAPLFAPSIGGLIAGVWGWRAVFVALALLGVVIGSLVLRWLPETLAVERRQQAGLGGALRGYRALLRDHHFVALAVLPGLGQATLMSYVVGSPYVLRQGFGLSANQFAALFAINGFGLVAGAQVNAWLVYRMAPIRILRIVLPVAIGIAVVLLFTARAGTGGLIGLLVPLWFLLVVNGFVPPNASALALSRHGERAGTAAAMIGSLQVGLAGVISSLVGLLGQDAAAMTAVMLSCLMVALGVLVFATPAYRRGGWTGI
jgi:DHA1 family bicyclomycin/chloramphenicol resistance-like MFS transporter